MELEALTRIWKLSPSAAALLLAFLQFRREPRGRLAHLARLEPRALPAALAKLRSIGLLKPGPGGDRRLGLVEVETFERLARRAAAERGRTATGWSWSWRWCARCAPRSAGLRSR